MLGETEPVFDAANVLRAGRDLFYLVSGSGNELGARWLQTMLSALGDYRVHVIRGVYPHTHIDSTISLLREGLVLLNPARITDPSVLPEPLASWEHLRCPPMTATPVATANPLPSEGSVSWDPQTHHAELLRIADVRAEGDAVTVGQFRLVEADHALAQRLNVAPQIVVDIALQIWGNTLTEERDARVARLGAMDLGKRHAHRGHITRELSQEIEAEIASKGLISHPEMENKEEERVIR